MNKRFMALLLSLVFVLGIFPINAVKASGISQKSNRFSVTSEVKKHNSPAFNRSEFEKSIVNSVLTHADSIDLTKYGDHFSFRYKGESLEYKTEEERNALITAWIYEEYPELDFQAYTEKYMDLYNLHKWSYGMLHSKGDPTDITIVSIEPQYHFTSAQYEERNIEYKAVAESMVADLKTAPLTDAQKALILHDRLATHCEYDQENYDEWLLDENYEIPPDSYNMYGALVNRVAVCQGYSKAYKYMLDLLGIPNRLCASNSAAHMWNIVTIDGKEYHVDVTHDDPVRDVAGHVSHTNFLVSTKKFNIHNINTYDMDRTPVDTTYDNFFWGKSTSAFQYVNGNIYYIDNKTSDLMMWNGSKNMQVVDIYRYANQNIRLCSHGNMLYYLYDDRVYEVDTSKTPLTAHVLWTPEIPFDYSSYGLNVEGNELVLQCFSSSDENEECIISHKIVEEIDITSSLKNALTNAVKNSTYNGKPKTFYFGAAYKGKLLEYGVDFVATYTDNVAAGKATVTLSGQNGYTGSASATFTISPKAVKEVTVASLSDEEYTGSAIKPTPKIASDGKLLKLGKDYVLSYKSNTNTGKASVIVKGIGNYTGEITRYFFIHPKTVKGVKFQTATSNSIKIKWKKVSNGTGYAVRRKTSKKGKFKTIAIISSLKKTSYTDKKVKANKTYYYDVVAFKTVDGKKYGSAASKYITAKTAAAAPKITYSKNISSKKAKIKWKKVSGAKGYKLYVSTKKKSGFKCVYTGSKCQYTKSKLKKGKTYYFKVKTYKKFGSKKLYSSYSTVKKVKISK